MIAKWKKNEIKIYKKTNKQNNTHRLKKKGRVGREKAIPAIKDKLMNWSYAVQPGD